MPDEKLTPEYIVSQIGILSIDEIRDLIENYGNEQYDEASRWADKDAR